MSRETYMPPLTNAEIIQIAAARRAGDVILRKVLGRQYATSVISARFALSEAGIRSIGGPGVEFRYTVIARFRVVPPWQRASRKVSKPEPVSECFLMTNAGKAFLLTPDLPYAQYVAVPVELLALIDDTFTTAGAYKVDGGEFIQAAIARAVGHVVKQEQEREFQADIATQVEQMTLRQKLVIGAMMMAGLESEAA